MTGIQLALEIDLLIFATIICIIMYIYLKKNNDRDSKSLKILMNIILATAFLCIAETVTIVSSEGTTSIHRVINYWSSALFLSLAAFPGAIWLVYLDYKIIRKKGKYKRRYIFYFIPTVYFFVNCFIINTIVLKGFVFTIDEMNVYSRGNALWIHIIVMYLVLLISVVNFYRTSNMIKGRVTQAILIVVLVPIVGNVIQMLFYGVTVSIPSYVLAAFMVYLILEKDEMQRDSLTKLYTRSYLEERIMHKLSVKDRFSLIMIDLNDFKMINDTYGHHVGDEVLKTVANILSDNIRLEDEVCRFGGDEFFIILEDVRDIGQAQIKMFDEKIDKVNKTNQEYSIDMSYGLVYVDYKEEYSMYELLKKVDKKMYEDKKLRKANIY